MSINIAHVLFYRTNYGQVFCKVNFGGTGISYRENLVSKYRKNKDYDCEKYPFIITLDYIDAFLDSNQIDICVVDDRSIKRFYGFSNGRRMCTFINPTQKQVDEWHSFNTPNLYRFEINTGEAYAQEVVQRILLAEWKTEKPYVSDQMSKIEVFLFTKNHSSSIVSKAMMGKVI